MSAEFLPATTPLLYHLFVRKEADERYIAGIVGLPEVRATGATEEEALVESKRLLTVWLSGVRWVQVRVAVPVNLQLDKSAGFVDPNDPAQKEYRELLAKMREEDRERTFQEYQEECSGSSSTPTT